MVKTSIHNGKFWQKCVFQKTMILHRVWYKNWSSWNSRKLSLSPHCSFHFRWKVTGIFALFPEKSSLDLDRGDEDSAEIKGNVAADSKFDDDGFIWMIRNAPYLSCPNSAKNFPNQTHIFTTDSISTPNQKKNSSNLNLKIFQKNHEKFVFLKLVCFKRSKEALKP